MVIFQIEIQKFVIVKENILYFFSNQFKQFEFINTML